MTKKKKIWIVSVICAVLLMTAFGAFLMLKNRFVGNGNVLGVSWYHENGTEFTITTAEELYEFAELSAHYDFKDQTILLGNDIVVNEGEMDTWLGDIWAKYWTPIDGFAGTFDGQGYTISGIYSVGYGSRMDKDGYGYKKAGLFMNTRKNCVVRDLRIENSYFYGESGGRVGSVTSSGGGTFEGIYSNAIVVCDGRLGGGLIGYLDAKGSHTITNCWFDGELRLQGPWSIYNGGIVGYAQNVSGTIAIEHCLVTADISCEVEDKDLCLGGFVGITEQNARVNIKDCLNVGTMNVVHKSLVGSVIGKHDNGAVATMTNVYTSLGCYDATIGINRGSVIGYPLELEESKLIGVEAAKWTELDFKEHWTLVEGGTPRLLFFTDRDLKDTKVEKAYDISWYNESEDVYTISNAKELYGLSVLSTKEDFAGKTIKLGADIVLNGGEAKNWGEDAPENRWYPIQNFSGVFDGQGHTISGVYVKTSQLNSGFFSATTQEAMVKNLRLENSYFENTSDNQARLGSIVGSAKGRIQTLYSNAIVVSSGSICGGIIGVANDSGTVRIVDCWFDGSVEQTQHFGSGGVVGCAEGGGNVKIEHCLNSGTITGVATVAGICGLVSGKTSVNITDSLNTGEIISTKHSVFASIITQRDEQSSLRLKDCFGAEEDCQHIIWQTHGKIEGNGITMEKARLTGNKGYQWTTLNFEKYWSVVKDSTPILQSFTKEVPSLAGVKRKFDISWYDEDKNSYTLNSAEDLYGLYMLSNITDFKGKTVKLGKDIVVNHGDASEWGNKVPANVWYPISVFSGVFDGQGHSISGLYLKTDKRGTGMFSQTTKESVLKNFRLVNSYFENTNEQLGKFGSVAGIAQGNLLNIYSDAFIVSSASVCGGLVGSVSGDGKVDISNCWYAGKLTQTANFGAGGLIGVIEGGCNATISHCLNTGAVTGLTTVSGICGLITDEKTAVAIRDTLNTGKVTSTKGSVFAAIITQRAEKTIVKIEDTYSTLESCIHSVWHTSGSMNGNGIQLSEKQLKGYGGYQWTFLDFSNYWATVADATPVLKTFAQGALNLEGISKKVDVSWYDSSQPTYILDSMEDLHGFGLLSKVTDFKGKTVQLAADIVVNTGSASDWKANTPENEWYPISTFAGIFDGQGHSISGLYLKTDVRGVGMFSQITKDSVLKNFKLVNSYFENTNEQLGKMGSIVGIAQGSLLNLYSDAVVVSSASVCGGLVGSVSGDGKVDISNCWYAGTLTQTANFGAGGLIGVIEGGCDATISHCLNTGEVTGLTSVSGICGLITDEKTAATIQDTLNAGKVTSTKGSVFAAIITQRAKNTTVKMKETYSTLESCIHSVWHTSGDMDGNCIQLTEDQLKGYGGYQWTFLDFSNYWATVADATPVLKTFAQGALSLEGISRKVDISWYDSGKSTYTLDSAEDLYGFYLLSNITDFKGKTVQLGADIVVNKGTATTDGWKPEVAGEIPNQWYPINNFAGSFNGQGNSVSGICFQGNSQYNGFFKETTETAVVENFIVENSYFESTATGQAWIGSIVGSAAGTFKTIYSDAIVVSNGSVTGGLIGGEGVESDVEILNCWFDGKVIQHTSTAFANGGIIGYIENGNTNLQQCLNTGTIEGGTRVGGICGTLGGQGTTLTIKDSLNSGKVSGDRVGAVVSQTAEGTIVNISNTYCTLESHNNKVFQNAGTMNGSPAQHYERNLKNMVDQNNIRLDFTKYWAMQYDFVPILRSFVEYSKQGDIDISWYNATASEMQLDSLAQLKGFNYIANTNNVTFKNKTVKLGSDIVMPDTSTSNWSPIKKFEGTFDGQGHSISGVMISGAGGQGFFNKALECTIKNFRLIDSSIYSTNIVCGSIAAQFTGTMEGVYSNADVTLAAGSWRGYVGGLVGVIQPASAPSATAPSKSVISNCQYAGNIVSNGCYVGGITGTVDQYNYTELKVSNCLVTGTLTSSRSDDNAMGGFCGTVAQSGNKFTVENSMFVGTISSTGSNPISIGEVLGEAKGGTITLTNVYGVDNACAEAVKSGVSDVAIAGVGLRYSGVTFEGKAELFADTTSLKGNSVKDNTKLDFKTPVWVTRDDDFPMLKIFETLGTSKTQ